MILQESRKIFLTNRYFQRSTLGLKDTEGYSDTFQGHMYRNTFTVFRVDCIFLYLHNYAVSIYYTLLITFCFRYIVYYMYFHCNYRHSGTNDLQNPFRVCLEL